MPIGRAAQIIEAYVLLEQADPVDTSHSPISLHAARITQPWDSRSTTWGLLPHFDDRRSPSTTVRVNGPVLVRVDVRDIVKEWRKQPLDEFGIALVADERAKGADPTGIAFALNGLRAGRAEIGALRSNGASELGPSAISGSAGSGASGEHVGARVSEFQYFGPRLELYVK